MTYVRGKPKELPHIDEHAIVVEAAPERVWTALGEVLSRDSPPATRMIGHALGVRPLDPSGDPLAFPGTAGRGYRTLVIGTRGHVVAVRRLLRATRRRAES